MVEYDASVIRQQAQRLYDRAAQLQISAAVVWGLAGGAFGYIFAELAHSRVGILYDWDPMIVALLGAVICGVLGYASAADRAFRLRLEAQVALCQVQIASNTAARVPTRATATSSALDDDLKSA